MASDDPKLRIATEVDVKQLERQFDKLRRDVLRQTDGLSRDTERSLERMSRASARSAADINARLAKIGSGSATAGLKSFEARIEALGASSKLATIGRFLPSVGAAASVGALKAYSDEFIGLQNALKVTGLEGERLENVFGQLVEVARRQTQPLGAVVGLYAKASGAAKDLGASEGDLIKFTEGVAQALRIAGTNPAAASGALLQLGQLLGSARVQAEEFNSINEGARPILQAVADGLIEAGGSVSKLKQLVNDGEVSNRTFFEAFRIGSERFKTQLKGVEQTSESAWTAVRNELTITAGAFNKETGFTDSIVRAFKALADVIREVAPVTRGLATELRTIDEILTNFGKRYGLGGKTIPQLLGVDNDGTLKAPAERAVELERRLAALKERYAELTRTMGDQPQFAAELKQMRDAIGEVERKLLDAKTARDALLKPGDGVAVPQSAPAPASNPISVTKYPVEGADKATADKASKLNKDFGAVLQELIAEAKAAGHDISVISGKRDTARQAQLWAQALAKYGSAAEARKWVAPPGRSMHERGLAADLSFGGSGISAGGGSAAARDWVHANAARFGLKFPLGNEPWHIEPSWTRGGSGMAKTDEQKRAEDIKRVTDALKLEEQQLGKNALQKRIIRELDRAGVTADSAEGKAIASRITNIENAEDAERINAEKAREAERDRARRAEQIVDLERERAGIEKTAEARRIENELARAGVSIQSTEGQLIAQKISQIYALQAAKDAAAEASHRLADAEEEFASTGADATKSFVSALREGKSAADALKAALNSLIDRLLNSAIDSLWSGLAGTLFGGGSGAGGGLGGLIGGLFGKASGGPVSKGQAYMVGERGREAFIPGENGRIIPNHALTPRIAIARSPTTNIAPMLRMSVQVAGPMGDRDLKAAMEQTAATAANRAYAAAVQTSRRQFPANSKFYEQHRN